MNKLIGMLLVGIIPAPLFWFSSMISFHPLRIMRQRGIKAGQKWVLRDFAGGEHLSQARDHQRGLWQPACERAGSC